MVKFEEESDPENPTLCYDVSIRCKPNLKNVFFKQISIKRDNNLLIMKVKGAKQEYEIIQVIRNKSNQAILEVQLRGNEEIWIVEFQSIYKAFQFY